MGPPPLEKENPRAWRPGVSGNEQAAARNRGAAPAYGLPMPAAILAMNAGMISAAPLVTVS